MANLEIYRLYNIYFKVKLTWTWEFVHQAFQKMYLFFKIILMNLCLLGYMETHVALKLINILYKIRTCFMGT